MFESNLHVVKADVLPVTILEHYYRKHPDLLSKAHITNAVQVGVKRVLLVLTCC